MESTESSHMAMQDVNKCLFLPQKKVKVSMIECLMPSSLSGVFFLAIYLKKYHVKLEIKKNKKKKQAYSHCAKSLNQLQTQHWLQSQAKTR